MKNIIEADERLKENSSVPSTKEQALKWLEHYSDEEVHVIFSEIIRIRRNRLQERYAIRDDATYEARFFGLSQTTEEAIA